MKKPLWIPSKETVDNSNVKKFIDYINRKYDLEIEKYDELYKWSIDNIPEFWLNVWDFVNVIYHKRFEKVVDDLNRFPGARWFIGAKLNFAENLLRYRDSNLAFIQYNEKGKIDEVSYSELYNKVSILYDALKEIVIPNDRVACYMPNIIETVIAMLASTSLGAIWSSCGTELGYIAVIDRIGQLNPKILFTVDGYYYKGKFIDILPNIEKIAKGIPSLEKIIVLPYARERIDLTGIPNAISYNEFLESGSKKDIKFESLSSENPLYIMFSSGTTGKPKCMVQSIAGVLVNHLKELIIHTDLKREDKITYITSPSWMMWNWLISSLGVGATIVLYDGNPLYPSWERMWKIIEDERITIFGCSASYINSLRSFNAIPKEKFDLSSLREISQTGSPLSSEGFIYVYNNIKDDLHFNSISGGTDINGCFVAGTPIQPVYAGEIQGPALGMKVNAYDENGNPVRDREAELVCEAPSPSMPIYFWNDVNFKKYLEAYFLYYKDKNVWRHGDLVIFHSDTGGITILGRSDYTLKPSGVRIGPAEIYRIVEKFNEISDSLAVGQRWKEDERIILFVKMKEGYKLDENLKEKIKKALREEASPRHVPSLIIEVPDIPYTYNMKKVESAVYNLINGRPVTNRDALINPESLDYIEKILPLLQEE